jgi:CheY-like chemotaxis protein
MVSDIGMPEEDGYELIGKVRALPAEKGGRIPAVALTAYARVEDRVRALDAGLSSARPETSRTGRIARGCRQFGERAWEDGALKEVVRE